MSNTPHGYCRRCGHAATEKIPSGDNRKRIVCASCDMIHYENPNNVVGCLLEWRGSVLLCQRAIEPRRGYWTLPAGFMENGESTLEGAMREAQEEALAECEELKLFGVLAVQLFDEKDIPWDEIAFPVVTEVLKRYCNRHNERSHQVHLADIYSRPGEPLNIVRHT